MINISCPLYAEAKGHHLVEVNYSVDSYRDQYLAAIQVSESNRFYFQ